MTGLTVTWNDLEAVNAPSETLTVIVATPDRLLAGETLTVRSVLDPPNEIPLTGISAVFEEVAETVRLPFVLSASVTLNAIEPVVASSLMFWLGIEVMVGAVLPDGGGGGSPPPEVWALPTFE